MDELLDSKGIANIQEISEDILRRIKRVKKDVSILPKLNETQEKKMFKNIFFSFTEIRRYFLQIKPLGLLSTELEIKLLPREKQENVISHGQAIRELSQRSEALELAVEELLAFIEKDKRKEGISYKLETAVDLYQSILPLLTYFSFI